MVSSLSHKLAQGSVDALADMKATGAALSLDDVRVWLHIVQQAESRVLLGRNTEQEGKEQIAPECNGGADSDKAANCTVQERLSSKNRRRALARYQIAADMNEKHQQNESYGNWPALN